MHQGNFEEAEKKLSHIKEESTLLLLSQAMVDFQTGKYRKSSSSFERALDLIDYYNQPSAAEMAGQTLIQDSLAAYSPPLFEQSTARFYQALAFLHDKEEDNAAATLYYLENHLKPNPLTSYLLALFFQRRGDHSNARILSPHLSHGNVLLIHHRGAAPHKKSETVPASIVSAALLEKLLQTQNVRPALSTLAGIPIPVLHDTLPRPHTTLRIDKNPLSPAVRYDIDTEAAKALQQEMPGTAARAAARILLRRSVVAATRQKGQPLVDIAMLVSNLATQADTRSWTMLPSCIDLYHFDLSEGVHTLEIGSHSYTLQISKGLHLIEIFEPKTEIIYLTQGILS